MHFLSSEQFFRIDYFPCVLVFSAINLPHWGENNAVVYGVLISVQFNIDDILFSAKG